MTVATTDHGEITIPEPSWCAGQHPAGAARIDITHLGKPVGMIVHTHSHGDVQLFSARIAQFPYISTETEAVRCRRDGHGRLHRRWRLPARRRGPADAVPAPVGLRPRDPAAAAAALADAIEEAGR